MRQTSDVLKMFSCVGLDCEIRAHFFLAASSLRLTQISQISLNFSFDGVKSHRCSPPPRSMWLTQIQRIQQNNLWKFVIICGRKDTNSAVFLFNLLNLCELFHQQIRICARNRVLNDVKKCERGGGGGGGSLRKSEIYR